MKKLVAQIMGQMAFGNVLKQHGCRFFYRHRDDKPPDWSDFLVFMESVARRVAVQVTSHLWDKTMTVSKEEFDSGADMYIAAQVRKREARFFGYFYFYNLKLRWDEMAETQPNAQLKELRIPFDQMRPIEELLDRLDKGLREGHEMED